MVTSHAKEDKQNSREIGCLQKRLKENSTQNEHSKHLRGTHKKDDTLRLERRHSTCVVPGSVGLPVNGRWPACPTGLRPLGGPFPRLQDSVWLLLEDTPSKSQPSHLVSSLPQTWPHWCRVPISILHSSLLSSRRTPATLQAHCVFSRAWLGMSVMKQHVEGDLAREARMC